jgi:hypothetical protein
LAEQQGKNGDCFGGNDARSTMTQVDHSQL